MFYLVREIFRYIPLKIFKNATILLKSNTHLKDKMNFSSLYPEKIVKFKRKYFGAHILLLQE